MSIIDEIYYENNPEVLELGYRDYLSENNLTESEFSLMDYCNEM